MSDALVDPWDQANNQRTGELIDPWDAAVAQQSQATWPETQTQTAVMQPAPPVSPVPSGSSIVHVPTPQVPAPAPTVTKGPPSEVKSYLITAGVLGGLAYVLWRFYLKDHAGEGVEGLDDLGDSHAVKINEARYVMVEEIERGTGRNSGKTKVKFPESGLEVFISNKVLLTENQAKAKGLEED